MGVQLSYHVPMTTPQVRDENYWLQRMEADRKRVKALQADLSVGMDEVEAAHKHGFATSKDLGLGSRYI